MDEGLKNKLTEFINSITNNHGELVEIYSNIEQLKETIEKYQANMPEDELESDRFKLCSNIIEGLDHALIELDLSQSYANSTVGYLSDGLKLEAENNEE